VIATTRALPRVPFTEGGRSPTAPRSPPVTRSLAGRQFLQNDPFGKRGIDVRSLGNRNAVKAYAFTYPVAGSLIWQGFGWIDATGCGGS
jgi:hypothetical protein